jgi:probable phosphoglycerate mutase
MKLVLVRHGRPDEDDLATPHDPPLRDDGWRQARAVARLLASEGVTRIVSSPLQRARQTAEPLAHQLSLPIDVLDGWAEADKNTSRYRSTETLRAQGHSEWQRFLEDPVRYVGGDPESFQAGVLNALDEVLQGGDRNHQVVVFTHGLPINTVLSHVLGLRGIIHFHPGYGSLTRLRALPDVAGSRRRIGVVSINESGHHAWPEVAA